MTSEQFGSDIKARRKELGYTLCKVKELTGIAVSRLSTIEQGKAFPRFDQAVDIVIALGCTLKLEDDNE